jgi:sugar phosphate isomerase/epimerase
MRHTAIDRRGLLGLFAAAAASPLTGCASMTDGAFFARHRLPVGIQLYTLGELTRNDLDGTLKQVSAIGYKTVETAGYIGRTPAQLRAAFDKAGLACTSAHVGLRAGSAEEPGLLGDLAKLAADMHVLGATDVVAPSFSAPADLAARGITGMSAAAAAMTDSHWKAMGDQLNGIGAALKKEGLGFGYHNHNAEFVSAGGRTGLDRLIDATDPKLVSFELDIGWAASAGFDPARVFASHPRRFRLAHIKDLKASTQANTTGRMDPTEVGAGRLDWAVIMPAAYRAGVRKFFVEQEPPFAFPRLESAAKGYAFLSALKA